MASFSFFSLAFFLFISLAYAQNTIVSVTPVWSTLGSSHHAEKYHFDTTDPASQPVVARRGLSFDVNIVLTKALSDSETLHVVFTPTIPNLKLAFDAGVSAPSYNVKISLPSDTPVQEYSLTISITSGSQTEASFALKNPFWILFNPYNPQDQTYYSNQTELVEYIENEYGTMWLGSYPSPSNFRWYYAQYDPSALRSAFYIISRYVASQGNVSDLPLLTRWFSQYLTVQQANNNEGVLLGRWSGSYADGTEPTLWTGSDKILKQYVKTGFQTVKYAQCWVFGGIFTTLMRALGVPIRQVFTFESAHEEPDSNGDFKQIFQEIRDQNGRLIEQKGGSVWNFHSWNEVYFNSNQYGQAGWQAIDGTPQELSSGSYRMGPAPKTSIKNYHLGEQLPFDVAFVRSEVASTIMIYQYTCNSDQSKCTNGVNIRNYTAGALILTSSNIIAQRQDITSTYKDISNTRHARNVEDDSSKLRASIKVLQQLKGGDFQAVLEGTGAPNSKVDAVIDVNIIDDRGVILRHWKTVNLVLDVTAAGNFAVTLYASVEDFLTFVKKDQVMYSLSLKCNSTNQTYALTKQVHIDRPVLSVSVTDTNTNKTFTTQETEEFRSGFPPVFSTTEGTILKVKVSFTNPYPVPISNLKFLVSTGRLFVHPPVGPFIPPFIHPRPPVDNTATPKANLSPIRTKRINFPSVLGANPSSTAIPSTSKPTTSQPTTQRPSTSKPTTQQPTTQRPTTQKPTTQQPTTQKPTTQRPTTQRPTTQPPTTQRPTTQPPTTQRPTTQPPTTQPPTTQPPTTQKPTTQRPPADGPFIHPRPPTTQNPSTVQPPATQNPTTTRPFFRPPHLLDEEDDKFFVERLSIGGTYTFEFSKAVTFKGKHSIIINLESEFASPHGSIDVMVN